MRSSTRQEMWSASFTHLIRHAISFVFNHMPSIRKSGRAFADRVCAVVATPSARAALAHIHQAAKITKTIELRLDWLRSDKERAKLLSAVRRMNTKRITLIATCRRILGGGRL